MELSKARELLARPSWGVWSVSGRFTAVDSVAELGFDWVCLDAQHGRWDDRSIVGSIAGHAGGKIPIFVRVLSSNVALIGRALDAGAAGIIVPMVENAEQAAATVDASRYPPVGKRSWGPIKAYGEASQAVGERVEPFLAVMIETATALNAAESIAAVPGVDMLFVGPFDLSLSLGLELDDMLHSDAGPLHDIVAAARAAGRATGAYAGDPARARRLREIGFDLVAATTEPDLMQRGGREVLGILG
ncbi:HpcH/HpaI aldolase family protein [Gulosibacter chungangensis]|nr:aldolase/citrate lyase family protein [Gulosibacter chungangensis]